MIISEPHDVILLLLKNIEGLLGHAFMTEGKLNAEEYRDQILDKKLFDFWLINMKELEDVIVMENRVSYHKDATLVRHWQYEENNLTN